MGLGGFIFCGSFELAKTSLEDALRRPPEARGIGTDPAQANGGEALGLAPASAERLSEPAHSQVAVPGARESRAPAAASVSFTAGLVAGIAVDVPLHPVDTLKTRMQAREGFTAVGGKRGLWSGLSAVLVMSVPGSAIFFLVYDQAQQGLERHSPLAPLWRDGVSACLADAAACSVRVPCEVVKQRMQASRSREVAGAEIVRSICNEGPRGFFAGLGATVVRDVPFALIQMPLFEELKQRHPWGRTARATGDTNLQGLVGMTSGGLAGAVAGFLTTPLDTAKTRLMLTERSAERHGLVETLKRIGAESGPRGLFSGVAPRTLHSCVGGALWLGAFEWSKLLLGGAFAD